MTSYIRQRVIWIDPLGRSVDSSPFHERELVLEEYIEPAGIMEIERARALIFRPDLNRRGHFTEWLKASAESLLDHGVLLFIIAADDREFIFTRHAVKLTGLPESSILQLTAPRTYAIAERIARARPEPVTNPALNIVGGSIDARFELYLRRAFRDCDSIAIERLSGGHTATVVSVDARFTDSVVGPRPFPFFVKFGEAARIRDEHRNYQLYVSHYIPFSLRPNLDETRCLIGPTHGVLVGNFVAQSESLLESLRRGAGPQSIYSLFEQTLAGWRLQAYEGPLSGIRTAKIHDSLSRFSRPERITAQRLEQATQMGASRLPADLHAVLAGQGEKALRTAPMHGDLHSGNVRVRGFDSILIDFQLVRHGLLVADPACLEVSLVFTAAGDSNNGWTELVDTLYQLEYLDHAPPPSKGPSKREWLWSAVRQIRLIALGSQLTPREYQIALAYCLLRRARLPDDSGDDEYRGAYAYVIAERLIADLSK